MSGAFLPKGKAKLSTLEQLTCKLEIDMAKAYVKFSLENKSFEGESHGAEDERNEEVIDDLQNVIEVDLLKNGSSQTQ